MEEKHDQPFASLGAALKKIRVKASKSEIELSGALEVAPDKIYQYELGRDRPSKDILYLYISHFNLAEADASSLWKLAGYGEYMHMNPVDFMEEAIIDSESERTVFVSAQDARIVYTDLVHIVTNNFGVVINFMQTSGMGNKPMAISRVGMSHEHARSLLGVLTQSLQQIDKSAPKQIESKNDTQAKSREDRGNKPKN